MSGQHRARGFLKLLKVFVSLHAQVGASKAGGAPGGPSTFNSFVAAAAAHSTAETKALKKMGRKALGTPLQVRDRPRDSCACLSGPGCAVGRLLGCTYTSLLTVRGPQVFLLVANFRVRGARVTDARVSFTDAAVSHEEGLLKVRLLLPACSKPQTPQTLSPKALSARRNNGSAAPLQLRVPMCGVCTPQTTKRLRIRGLLLPQSQKEIVQAVRALEASGALASCSLFWSFSRQPHAGAPFYSAGLSLCFPGERVSYSSNPPPTPTLLPTASRVGGRGVWSSGFRLRPSAAGEEGPTGCLQQGFFVLWGCMHACARVCSAAAAGVEAVSGVRRGPRASKGPRVFAAKSLRARSAVGPGGEETEGGETAGAPERS